MVRDGVKFQVLLSPTENPIGSDRGEEFRDLVRQFLVRTAYEFPVDSLELLLETHDKIAMLRFSLLQLCFLKNFVDFGCTLPGRL
jgi:hypothetical protein